MHCLAQYEDRRRAGYQAMLADPQRKAAMLRKVHWTEDMIDALRQLRGQRASIETCAALIGVNKCVIVKQLDALGLPRTVR